MRGYWRNPYVRAVTLAAVAGVGVALAVLLSVHTSNASTGAMPPVTTTTQDSKVAATTGPGGNPTIPPTSSPTTSGPPTTPVSKKPSPPQKSTVMACLDSVDADLTTRYLSYEPSQHMAFGAATNVLVTLGNTKGGAKGTFLGSSTTTATLQTPCSVSAQLIGSQFNISPATQPVSTFVDGSLLAWNWSVSPTMTGNLQLELEISPVYDGQYGNPTTFKTTIEVTSSSPSFFNRLAHDLSVPGLSIVSGTAGGVATLGMTLWIERSRRRPAHPRKRVGH